MWVAPILQSPLGKLARGFHKLRVIERHQGLERRVGALPADGAGFPRWSVKNLHVRRRRLAFPEVVNRASIKIFTRVLDVPSIPQSDDFPDVGGLVGLGPRAAHFGRKGTGGGEGVVTNHLGIHAEPWSAREQAVVGILLEFVGGDLARLAIRGRSEQQSEEALHVPAGLPEFHGEPVE